MNNTKNLWLSLSSGFIILAIIGINLGFKPVNIDLKNNNHRALYTFRYTGPDFSITNVQNEANWTYSTSPDLCDGIDEKACTIQVSDAYVNNPSSSPTLNTTANVTATLNSAFNTAYVSDLADPSGVIANRPN